VRRIDRIFETNWHNIRPPASGLGRDAFITGVTEFDGQMVQIVDIELVISDIFPQDEQVIEADFSESESTHLTQISVLAADDSVVARRIMAKMLDAFSIPHHMANNGHDALNILVREYEEGHPVSVLLSDIEMPGLNGYELTAKVRSDNRFADLFVILHTSLSSEMSIAGAKKVGANEALTKFNGNELIRALSHGAEHFFALMR
jgi:two-component system chemotaxis response regulator CheV